MESLFLSLIIGFISAIVGCVAWAAVAVVEIGLRLLWAWIDERETLDESFVLVWSAKRLGWEFRDCYYHQGSKRIDSGDMVGDCFKVIFWGLAILVSTGLFVYLEPFIFSGICLSVGAVFWLKWYRKRMKSDGRH